MIKVKCLISIFDFGIEGWEAAVASTPEPSWNRNRKKGQKEKYVDKKVENLLLNT